jgi:hypothetical protein
MMMSLARQEGDDALGCGEDLTKVVVLFGQSPM